MEGGAMEAPCDRKGWLKHRGCLKGTNRQAQVMLSPPLAPHLHPLTCFLTDPEHCFSLHHDDETPS
jgi:hypothetical protein